MSKCDEESEKGLSLCLPDNNAQAPSSKTSPCVPFFHQTQKHYQNSSEDCKTSHWPPLIVTWLTEEAALDSQQKEGNHHKMGAV